MFSKKEKTPKRKERKLWKKIPKWLKITLPIVLVVAIAVSAFFIFGKNKAENAMATTTDYVVRRGNIRVTITGSGSIEPNDQYTITPLVKGEILSCSFEEGDMVNEGDVLYVIDSSDQETNVKKAENSLKQAESSLEEAKEGYDDLKITSTVSGTVTAVYAEVGDNIGANGKVLDVVNTDVMTLKVPFNANDAAYIYSGASASVNLEGAYYTLNGTVKYIAQGSSITDEGVEVKYAEIEVKNPGGIRAGDKATAVVGSVACNQAGTFESSKTVTISSKGSGKITFQPYRVGDVITTGSTVLQLETKNVDKQVENAERSFENAELSYINTLDQLDNYKIKAPISGTVIQKNSKAGDKLDNGTGAVSMAVIADMSRMTFNISIDELDIQNLKVGQKAQITADAFKDKRFTGTVDYISVIGSTSNGVTTYPVTIVLDDPGELLPGMNVDATIVVKESYNTLMVPVEAVQRNNIVYVKEDGSEPKSDDSKKGDGVSSETGENGEAPQKAYPGMGQPGAAASGETPQRTYPGGAQPGANPTGEVPQKAYPGAEQQTAGAGEEGTKPKTAVNNAENGGQKPAAAPENENAVKAPAKPAGNKPAAGQQKPQGTDTSSQTQNPQMGNAPQGQFGQQQPAGNNADGGEEQNGSGSKGFGSFAPEGYKAVKVTLGINNDSYIEILSGLKEGDVIYVPESKRNTNFSGFTMPGGGFGGMGGMSGMPSGGFGGTSRMPTGGASRTGGMMR